MIDYNSLPVAIVSIHNTSFPLLVPIEEEFLDGAVL
jgi:hypothetical protein